MYVYQEYATPHYYLELKYTEFLPQNYSLNFLALLLISVLALLLTFLALVDLDRIFPAAVIIETQ